MMRRLLIVGIVLLCLIGSVSAQHDIFKKNGAKSDINVTSDLASVSYTNTANGVSFYHTVFIDGSLMAVNYNSQSSTREVWGSGNGQGNSDILIQHDFDGSVNDTLKGTITIKTPHTITFPYTLSYGESIYPYESGFKVTKGTSKYSPGVIITPPTAVNNTGGIVPVWYTYDASKITLNINDAGQEYPITIDPSFTPDIPLGYAYVSGFTYNITVPMGSQTDYQMKFILSNASGISGYYAPDNVIFTNGTTRPEWTDVNATDGSNTPLQFWLENNTRTSRNVTAWLKVPAITVDNASVGKWYYGNASQTESAMDNGYGVFLQFDDFLGTSINATKWTVTSGAFAVGSGNLSMSNVANVQSSFSSNYGQNTTAVYRGILTRSTSVYNAMGYMNATGGDQRIAYYADYPTSNNYGANMQKDGGAWSTSDLGSSYTGFHLWEIKRNGSTSVIWNIDGTTVRTATSGFPTVGMQSWFFSNGVASPAWDWLFIRKSVATEPITSLYSTSGIAPAPTASFTCAPTSTTLGTPITCTDASTNAPTNWTYYWGDGNVTDGTQNPSYTYPFTGTFSINQTVNNTIGSSWYNRSNYITITNVTSFTQQDIYLTGQYTITFNVKSSTTNLPIANVTVVDSVSGQSYPSTNGTAFLTLPAGLYYINFIADGYQTKQITYVVDQDETHEVTMVPSAPTSDPVYNVYPPKDVKFHITSFFGAPLTDATVTIQGITTSTGNWDWLVTLLGISLDEVAINGTAMSETTDSNGDVVFLMLPSVKYNITTTAPGYTFPTSFIAPQATEYTITANWNESWFSSGNDTLKDVNVSVSWVKFNDTYSFVNITYDDQTMTTTGGTITVYRDSAARVANASAVATMDITSSSCSNSTLVNTPTGGASYRVLVNATTTDENIMRTFTHYFKGSPVSLPGWTSETLLWLSLFIVIFTAAFAGAIHSPQMAIVLCVESWIFWAIGWLDALITQFWYGETAIIGVLVLASFLAVMWNITEGKSKVKRSS